MTRREVFLLLTVVAAASAAALSFQIAAHPDQRYARPYSEAFERARRVLPVLGAVRVRSHKPDAAHRLFLAGPGDFERIIDPARAARSFRYGRLLYGTPDQVRAARDAVRQGRIPANLPPLPDILRLFGVRRGTSVCDAIPSSASALARIRSTLPEATLSGEPVAQEQECAALEDLPRALILGLAAVCGWVAARGRRTESQRRLLGALLPLAVLGLVGWGVDPSALLAVVLVAAAPEGPPLLCGALGLFFPSLVMRRFGLVFLLGAFVRWRVPQAPAAGPRWRAAVLLGVLVSAGAALAWSYDPAPALPAGLHDQPAALILPLDAVVERARSLRAEGLVSIVGETDPVPPDPDLPTRRMLTEIFMRARVLARDDQRFEQVRDAAALESLYWPADLRARLRTTDGRAVLWAREASLVDRDEFMSAALYRLRGELGLRTEGRIAALVLLGAAGLVLMARFGARAPGPMLVRFLGILAGAALLLLTERGAAPLGAEAAYPLLVMAALAPSGLVLIGLAGAAAGLAPVLAGPAAALSLASGCAWLTRRRT